MRLPKSSSPVSRFIEYIHVTYPMLLTEETCEDGRYQACQSCGHFKCATRLSVQGMKDRYDTHQDLSLSIKGCPNSTKFLENLGWVDIVKQISVDN